MGRNTTASAEDGVAIGRNATASGAQSAAIGYLTEATKTQSFAFGYQSRAHGYYSIAAGQFAETTGQHAIALGLNTSASGLHAIALGHYSQATGADSFAEGGCMDENGTNLLSEWRPSINDPQVRGSLASGHNSHAEGCQTYASGYSSHAEGCDTEASGKYSHAEGWNCRASGDYASHAEGYNCRAGAAAHAEGYSTEAYGNLSSHAEGYQTLSSGGWGSHAEGFQTQAQGCSSHTGGNNTIASYNENTVIGRYNTDDRDAPLHIGAGNSTNRWTSFWVNWEGNLNISHYGLDGTTYNLTPAGDNWIIATHTWDVGNPINSALSIWDVPSDGGFHTWIRQRTANNYFVMGVIPANNNWFVATNPSGANTGTNAIAKQMAWNGSTGALAISGSYSSGSDRRLKNILGNTTNEETLAVLENVNIVNFSYKYDNDIENNIRSGIIAQDLQQILEEHNIENRAYLTTIDIPRNEALIEPEEDSEEEPWSEDEMTKEFLGISYVDLVPILIKGWQIHEQEIKELKARIQELEEK